MTEVLSQDEIDALLTAISTGEVDADDIKETGEHRKVKIYDFKRPDKFSKDQIRTLQMMHETFARLTTTPLSAQLRTLVHVHVADPETRGAPSKCQSDFRPLFRELKAVGYDGGISMECRLEDMDATLGPSRDLIAAQWAEC